MANPEDAKRKWRNNTDRDSYNEGVQRAERDGAWDSGVQRARNENSYTSGVADFLGVSEGSIVNDAENAWDEGVSDASWSPDGSWADDYESRTDEANGEKWERRYTSYYTED